MGEEHPIDVGIRMEGDSIKFYSERSAEAEKGHAFVLRKTREYLNSPADWFMGEEQWDFEGG